MNISAVDTVKLFYNEYLVKRSFTGASALMSENIEVFGTGAGEISHGKDEATLSIRNEIDSEPGSYNISYSGLSEHNYGDTATVMGNMHIHHVQLGTDMDIRLSISLIRSGNGYLIDTIHSSTATAEQGDSEGFPISFSIGEIERIKNDVLNSSVPGGVMIVQYNESYSLLFINHSLLECLGSKSDEELREACGNSISSLIHPDDTKALFAAINEATARDAGYTAEYRIRHRDGRYVWLHETGKLVSETGRLMCACQDITASVEQSEELRRKSDNLKAANARLRALMDTVPGGVFNYEIVGDRVNVVFFSNTAAAMHEMSYDEYGNAVKDNAFAMLTDGSVEMEREFISDIKLKGRFDRKLRVHTKSSYIWVQFNAQTISENEEHILVNAVMMDVSITEKYEQRSQEIISNVPIGLVLFSADEGKISPLYYNDQACRIFGVSREEFFTDISSGEPFGRLKPENSGNSLAILQQLNPGDSEEKVFDAVKKNGEKISVRVVYSFPTDSDQRVFYASLRDVTTEIQKAKETRSKDEMYRILVDSVNTNIFDYDPVKDRMVFSRHSAGNNQERVYNDFLSIFPSLKIVKDEECEPVIGLMKAALKNPGEGSFKIILKTSDGDKWHEVSYTSIADSRGKVYRCIGKVDDIQDSMDRELRLKESTEREAAYRKATLYDAILSLEYDMVTGDRVQTEFDIVPSSFKSTDTLFDIYYYSIMHLLHPDDVAAFSSLISFGDSGLILDSSAYTECRVLIGEDYRWISVSLTKVGGADIDSPHLFICVKNIDDRKAEEIRLKEIATKDRLTGLLNRISFEELCASAIENSEYEQSAAAFIIIDIDNFKSINDTYGHIAGDKILMTAAEKLRSSFRNTDYVGRLGGDEMAVFMTNIATLDIPAVKGDDICKALSEIIIGTGNSTLTCSVGVAVYPESGRTFGELYANADLALYQAKQSGRNRCCVYSNEVTQPKMGDFISKEWLIDAIDSMIYISDTESYDVYYMNKAMMKTFGIDSFSDKKCYELVYKRSSPCPFCTNHLLTYDDFYSWTNTNESFGITALLKDKFINWNGHQARMEIASEITEENMPLLSVKTKKSCISDGEIKIAAITGQLPFRYNSYSDRLCYCFRAEDGSIRSNSIDNFTDNFTSLSEVDETYFEDIIRALRYAVKHTGRGEFAFEIKTEGAANKKCIGSYEAMPDANGIVSEIIGVSSIADTAKFDAKRKEQMNRSV